MKSLPERIMEHGEATPICPAALLHLGQRAAVGQALSRLARSGRLMRIRYLKEWTVCSRHLTLEILVRISDPGGAN